MEEKILQISNSAGPIEEKKKDFEKSIFEGVYKKLDNIIDSIISEPEKTQGDVIALIGHRGSGKTSVMRSYTKALREVEASYENGQKYFVFEYIDASMLDAQEDIFDIILAKMLRDIDEVMSREVQGRTDVMNQSLYQNILQKFNHVFEAHQDIKRQAVEFEHQGYSSLSVLRKFQDSVELTKSFQELVEEYLQLMSKNPKGFSYMNEKQYLVISVDDLDMNVDNGFKSLEQLYRYIAVPNVILFVTIKFEQIEYLAEKKGYRLFPNINREIEGEKTEYVEKYAMDYLEKLIPVQNRVYMPDLSNRFLDYRTGWKIPCHDGKESLDLKTSLYRKIYESTGMCFNICGEKPYILEPESLREYNGYFNIFGSISEKELTNDEKMWNCERFIEDFFNRILREKLVSSYRREFLDLCEMGFPSVLNRLRGYANQLISERQDIGIEKDKQFRNIYRFRNGYGEILRDLSIASRNQNEGKRFGHAVLVLFTYAVQKELLNVANIAEKRMLNAVQKEHLTKENLEKILHNSWAGSWSNNLVRRLAVAEDININISESKDLRDVLSNIKQPRYWGCLEFVEDLNAVPIVNLKNNNYDDYKKWIDVNRGEIDYIELIFMLYEKFYNDEKKEEVIKFKIRKKDSCIRIDNASCDFNILGFIKNSFYAEKYFENLHAALAKAIAEFFTNVEMEDNNLRYKNEIEMYLRDTSILRKSFEKEERSDVVPVQHADIYYHMLNDLQKSYRNQINKPISQCEALEAFTDVLDSFKKYLKNEDEKYAEESIKFGDWFEESLFVKGIKDLKEKDNLKKQFGEMVYNLSQFATSNRRMAELAIRINTWDDSGNEDESW